VTQPSRRSPLLASLLAALLLVGLLPAGTLADTATTLTLSPAGTDAATYGDTATYSATLTVQGAGTPVAGVSISFDAVPSGGGATTDLGSATTDAAGVATLAANPVSELGAGAWLVSAHWVGDGTWDPDDSPATALTVSKKTLVITPDAKTVAYSSDPPAYTFGVSGWELGESKATAAGYVDPTCTSPYTTTSAAGTPLTITCSGGSAANYTFDTSASATLTVTKANQTIAFTSTEPTNATVGGPTYTPTATATSGLSVSFSIDATAAGICTIADGVVSFTGAGTCVIDVNQAGNTNWNAAAQVQQSFAVGGGSSTTTLSSNHDPSVFGQSVTFSATVSGGGGGTPTGTVTFRDGATVLGTGTLNGSGVATFTTSTLSVATHSITAAYGGNANYTASTSSALSQSVGKASTTLGLASSDASSTYGQSVTLTATVSVTAPGAGTASGTVQFGVDGVSLGAPVALAAGHASVTTSALIVGTHEVTAVYSGDGNLSGSSTTLAGGQAVAKATLTVRADPATREYGQPNPAFTAGISGFVNGETLATSGVGGTPACSSAATESSPVAGSPYAIACAVGSLTSANYAFSFVNGSLTVAAAQSAVTLVSDHNPAVPNQPATLTATVTGLVTGLPTPGGSVEFQAWNGATWTQLDSQTLTTGFSASTPLTLPATEGEYQYRAVFTSPDGNYSNATGELVQSIGRSPVTVSITASRPTWETNVPLVFTATITPDATNATVAVTGSVDFTLDGGAVQTVAVANGAAALPAVKFTAAGVAHTITAAYRPDAAGSISYEGATAPPLTATVVANTVSATGVGVSSTSIYPYRDSWRDTVSIRGTRNEPLSVTITIYSPTGSKIRTKTYTRAAGSYAYTWNGRYSSGSVLPSGRYKVVQKLADAYGAKKSYTSYVSLSRKRMYWYTKTIYASPGPRNYQMRSTTDTKLLSSWSTTSSTPLVMQNLSIDSTDTEWKKWIAVGYQFTLPSASTYTSVSFQVKQAAAWTGTTAPSIGLIPWNGGDWGSIYWGSSGTKSRARTAMGTSTTTYYAQTLTSLTGIRSGRYVRAAIDSYTASSGGSPGPFRYSFAAVKVVVKYGILK
jgi:Bacterial Ig-like domain (group 3)/MBG domain (YGX type)/FlgD Ig-like domain